MYHFLMNEGDWLARLAAAEGTLTRKQLDLVQWIRNTPHLAAFAKLAEFEALAGVSRPVIISFYRALGYERYQEFQKGLQAFYSGQIDSYRASSIAFRDVSDFAGLLSSCVSVEIDAMKTLERQIEAETLERLGRLFIGARTIYVYGSGTGFYPGHYLAQRMRTLGLKAFLVGTDREHLLDDFLSADKSDVFVSFHYTQDEDALSRVLEMCGDRGLARVLVTGSLDPDLCRLAEERIYVPRGSLRFKNSMAVPMAFAQMLLLGIELLGSDRMKNALRDLDRFSVDRSGK